MRSITNSMLIFLIFLFGSCNESSTNVEDDIIGEFGEELENFIKLESSIDIGNIKTNFEFKVTRIDPADSSYFSTVQLKWDFDSDGIFDTDWIKSDSAYKSYPSLGKHNITVKALFENNKTATYSISVYSQTKTDLFKGNVYELCYSHDEEKIFFSGGSAYHQIYSIDKNGNNLTCLTENLPQTRCRHYPASSPDGRFISYSLNGTNILDLETSVETEIFELFPQAFHSFTSDGKYHISMGSAVDGNSIHLVNVESLKDSLILTNAYNAVNIPNENKIAYYRYDADYSYPVTYSNVKIIFYDLETQQEYAVYDNVPMLHYFQVMNGAKAVYFVFHQIIYFLETGNSYKIGNEGNNEYDGNFSVLSKSGTEVLLTTSEGIEKMSLPLGLE